MKRTLLVLLGCILLSTPLAAQAQQYGDFTYYVSGSNVTITGYTGPGGAPTIPATITGLAVTAIADRAFWYNSNLTGVTIPMSVTSIGSRSFGACSSLTEITVVTNNPIYCSLDGVLFDKNTTTLIQFPGAKAGSYTIPNTVTIIGDLAFDGCTRLSVVTFPESVNVIGGGAFNDCRLLHSVTLPNSVIQKRINKAT